MEGRSISFTGYVARLGLLVDLALSLLQGETKHRAIRLCNRQDPCIPTLQEPPTRTLMDWPSPVPTHLLHLVDAMSSPVIFGLLLRDTGHNIGPSTQSQVQPQQGHSYSLPKN
jgi:hypothetical protein